MGHQNFSFLHHIEFSSRNLHHLMLIKIFPTTITMLKCKLWIISYALPKFCKHHWSKVTCFPYGSTSFVPLHLAQILPWSSSLSDEMIAGEMVIGDFSCPFTFTGPSALCPSYPCVIHSWSFEVSESCHVALAFGPFDSSIIPHPNHPKL